MKAGDDEIVVVGECVRQPLTLHQRECHGVRQREPLVVKPMDPVSKRALDEVGRDIVPLEDRIVGQSGDEARRGRRIEATNEVTMQLGEHEVAGDPSSARAAKTRGGTDGTLVVLITRACQREQRPSVYRDARGFLRVFGAYR